MENKVHPLPGYEPMPEPYPQPTYQAPNNTVVVVSQPEPQSDVDFRVKHGSGPGGFLIFIALVQAAVFAVMVFFLAQIEAEYIASFFLYFVTGVMACASASYRSASKGLATGVIVFAVFSMIMSIAQIGTRGLAVALGSLMAAAGAGGLASLIGNIITYANIVLLVLAFIAFACSISLIVLPSKVVCACCAQERQEKVVIQNNATPFTHTKVSSLHY